MISVALIRNVSLLVCFIILGIFFLKEKQSVKLNWSLFFSFIWMLLALPIINYKCVSLGYWEFLNTKDSILKIPYDILFVWYILWLVPFYFFKGKYILLVVLILFWLDILTMPLLEKVGILKLNANWYIGELLTIVFVFIPGYLWSTFYFENKKLWVRALLQVIVMGMFLTMVVPFLIQSYQGFVFNFGEFSAYWVQLFFIIAFPSLVAVIDLVEKGKGTPFPYDKTQNLVRIGVYAYIKNPIQWSFTVLFIPLAIYHESWLLFLGFVLSILYTVGVSNTQENEDMRIRFKEDWKSYKSSVPSWYFLWKPKNILQGVIYFKKGCNQCEEIKMWFEKQETINLSVQFSEVYKGEELLQVTYVDYLGNEYKSVKAIASAIEHINLGYASLGWFMRFPGVLFLLQTIIDALWTSDEVKCEIKN